jgi:transketolase
MGILADSELETYYTDGMRLPAHPPAGIFDRIPFATGSLGYGLSLASGLALSRRMRSAPGRMDCFCSDGEWQEGSTWEALILACRHKLSNLTVMMELISC